MTYLRKVRSGMSSSHIADLFLGLEDEETLNDDAGENSGPKNCATTSNPGVCTYNPLKVARILPLVRKMKFMRSLGSGVAAEAQPGNCSGATVTLQCCEIMLLTGDDDIPAGQITPAPSQETTIEGTEYETVFFMFL